MHSWFYGTRAWFNRRYCSGSSVRAAPMLPQHVHPWASCEQPSARPTRCHIAGCSGRKPGRRLHQRCAAMHCCRLQSCKACAGLTPLRRACLRPKLDRLPERSAAALEAELVNMPVFRRSLPMQPLAASPTNWPLNLPSHLQPFAAFHHLCRPSSLCVTHLPLQPLRASPTWWPPCARA